VALGGLGCWAKSSQVSFMSSSLPFGGKKGALLTACCTTTLRLEEPSGRWCDRFSAALRQRREGPISRESMLAVVPKYHKRKALHMSARRPRTRRTPLP
jgi:hypothetical protein